MYILYVILPSIAISIAYFSYLFDNLAVPSDTMPFYAPGPTYDVFIVDPLAYVLSQVAAWVLPGFAMQGFAIYLVIIWSRQHNRQFDAQPARSQDT